MTVNPYARRVRICTVDGTGVVELEQAIAGALTHELNRPATWSFTLPLRDPKAAAALSPRFREAQLWVGRTLAAWGPIIGYTVADGALVCDCADALWYLAHRVIDDGDDPNLLTNGGFDTDLAGWAVFVKHADGRYYFPDVNNTATRNGLAGYDRWGSMSVTSFSGLTYAQQQFTVTAGDFGLDVTASAMAQIYGTGPACDGLTIARLREDYLTIVDPATGAPRAGDQRGDLEWFTARGPDPDTAIAKTTIPENTPVGLWVRHSATVRVPPNTTAVIHVRLNGRAPGGGPSQRSTLWDAAGAWVDAALEYPDTDLRDIVAGIVEHIQTSPRSDLNLAVAAGASGFEMSRRYPFAAHSKAAEALDGLASEGFLDYRLVLTPTTRQIAVDHPRRAQETAHVLDYGGRVRKYRWRFDGEQAADSIVALGDGNAEPGRPEGHATDVATFADGLTLEAVVNAAAGTPSGYLDDVASEALTAALRPETLTVETSDRGRDLIGVLAVGDLVLVVIADGPLDLTGTYRVVRVVLTPADVLEIDLNLEPED